MSFWSRTLNVFRRARVDCDIDDELQSHVDEALAEGRHAAEARRALGSSLRHREASRDIKVAIWLEQTIQDLRFAIRILGRGPGFAAVAVLSLALGMGANTAIFSAINALLLRPLPVNHPDELVAFRIDDGNPKATIWYYVNFGYPDYQAYRDRTSVFTDIAAVVHLDRFGVAIDGETDAAPVRVALVSGNYFAMLGVGAARGRTLTANDDRVAGGHPVAVISSAYWVRRFGRAPDIVGRTLTLNATTFTVLGVTPPQFTGDWVGRPTDIWIPIAMQSEAMIEMPGLLNRPNGWIRLMGRRRAGVSIAQAEASVRVVLRQLQRERAGPHPTPERQRLIESDHVSLENAATGFSPQRATFGMPLSILMGIVGLVLLTACANVASLLLARATSRRQEITIRLALGASRPRIVQQLFTEGAVLAILGGTVGLLLAMWGTRVLSAVSFAPVQMDSRAASAWVSFDLRPDVHVVAFTAGLSVLTAILFALAPAIRGSNAPLRAGSLREGTHRVGALGRALVTAEVALSVLLMIGAGQFVRTFRNLQSVDLGLDRQHLLLVWTAPGQTGRDNLAIASLWRTIFERLSALPGVRSVGASNGGLLIGHGGGLGSEYVRIPGQPPRAGQFEATTAVTPGYFEALGLSLVAGRDFTELDDASRPPVTIVNETFARFFFGERNPIGQRYGHYPRDTRFPIEIVGVVKNTKNGTPREHDQMLSYVPYRQSLGLFRTMQVAVRVTGKPEDHIRQVQQELRRVDTRLPVLKIDTIDEQLDDVLAPERLTATFASLFGALATLMSCLGLYGVIAYAVARRTHEIGVRMSLGATRTRIFEMVSAESAALVLAGILIGTALAAAITRVLSSWWFGIGVNDPATFTIAVLLVVAVASVASAVPALRASRIDPMAAMRTE